MTNIRFFVRLAVIAQDIYKGLSSALREQSAQNSVSFLSVVREGSLFSVSNRRERLLDNGEKSVQNFMVCPEVILRTFQTA